MLGRIEASLALSCTAKLPLAKYDALPEQRGGGSAPAGMPLQLKSSMPSTAKEESMKRMTSERAERRGTSETPSRSSRQSTRDAGDKLLGVAAVTKISVATPHPLTPIQRSWVISYM